MTTDVDIANRALAESGLRSRITSFTDGSQEALYINLMYAGLRDFLLREGDYDFAATSAIPVPATTPPAPWIYSYAYPDGTIRIRQLVPAVYVPLNPQPIEWNIFDLNGATVILTKTSISLILFTKAPPEDNWDAMFTESFVRLLSSALVFALSNRIEASKERLSEAITFAGIANLRDS